MNQQQLPLSLLGRLDGPSVAPTELVKHATSYRHACRLAWGCRRVKGMTKRMLAEQARLHFQHVTDYLIDDDKPSRRSLPAECIDRFNAAVGNTLVTQYLNRKDALTVLEQMQADRAAA